MGASNGENGGVRAVVVPPETLAALPGTGWSDSYRVEVAGERSAPELYEALFAGAPQWFGTLMRLRDRIMAPFGVKPASTAPFPVVSSDAARMVVGYDDSHLDFRLVAEASPAGAGRTTFTMTTLVRFNNRLGRIYLGGVLPVHRRLAQVMMGNLTRRP